MTSTAGGAAYGVPGVRLEEVVPPAPRTLLTGVPVFLGYAEGAGGPRELVSWQAFQAAFTGMPADGYLADAVHAALEPGRPGQAYNLVDHLSVADNITLPVVLGGRPPDPGWLAELVSAVGLTGLEHRLPGELSGGQAQRVAIARALYTRPDVVFADEPTGALDSRTAAEILGVLRSTARALDQTVVLVTHDPQVAAAADRVLFLADGLLVDRLERPTAEQVTARMLGLGR